MNASTLLVRSRDLLQRASGTDALDYRNPEKTGIMWFERREAMETIEDLIVYAETLQQELIAYDARLYELFTRTSRGPTGHAWIKDLPHNVNPSAFFQTLIALWKWRTERGKLAQSEPET